MRIVLPLAALSGLLSVVLGAAGDHMPGFAANAHVFDTALRYHQLYSVLITALAVHGTGARLYGAALAVLLAGMAVFCGSLYALALTGVVAFGAMTPAGGLLLMGGWTLLAVHGWRRVPRAGA
jgi:uncharacterized membrane protein YgdD (TMEM256/DUF423 family)